MATAVGGEGLPILEPNKPSVARIYDYLLGGTHNFAADRDAAQAMLAQFPPLPEVLRTVRAFLRRATLFLAAEAGIRQFLDLGSGIPTVQNVHEIAQGVDPAARVAYVDLDPVAVAHSHSILEGNPNARCIQGDLRNPAAVCASREIQGLLDFSRPVAVIMSAVLHFIEDDEEATRIVDAYLDAVPEGSYLVICHSTSESRRDDEARARAIYSDRAQQLIPRTHAQISRFFDRTDLVDPGLVLTPLWRPDPEYTPPSDGAVPLYFGYAGVGRTRLA